MLDNALDDTPLTPPSLGLLDRVSTEPGISIADIARRLPTSAQDVSQKAVRLERLGYLERRLSDRGRGVALFVTAEGERVRSEANVRFAAFEAELAEALGTERYRALVELLDEAVPLLMAFESERRGGR